MSKDKLNANSGGVYFVNTLEFEVLNKEVELIPKVNSIIGVGGGVALDIAKFFSWKKKLPLFQLPTSIATSAVFWHRVAVRKKGKVNYLGWVVPEAIFIDFDVVKSAPCNVNRAEVGDLFCMHDALFDWKLATKLNKENKYP